MRVTALSFALTACALTPTPHPPRLALPLRPANAAAAITLLPELQRLSLTERERLLWSEFEAGNVPTFLRELVPVTTECVVQGRTRTATFWCTKDYLGVGSDQDWLRTPMTPALAQRLADRLDCVLPTRRMVDTIWAAAPLQLPPMPFDPAVHAISSVAVFHQHHARIEAQRQGASPALLIAGIKKDLVASPLLANWPGHVVIYGWHRPDGSPIQPLSKVHADRYVDYSHGVRLVARHCEVDGVPTTVDAVLADPLLHPLLSDEGPFATAAPRHASNARYPAR